VTPGAQARPPPEGGDDLVELGGQRGQVTVVDESNVDLTSQITQSVDPCRTSGRHDDVDRLGDCDGHVDLDDPLDELHCNPAGGRGPALLPGAVTAGGGAPGRHPARWPYGDFGLAPDTGDQSQAVAGVPPAVPQLGFPGRPSAVSFAVTFVPTTLGLVPWREREWRKATELAARQGVGPLVPGVAVVTERIRLLRPAQLSYLGSCAPSGLSGQVIWLATAQALGPG